MQVSITDTWLKKPKGLNKNKPIEWVKDKNMPYLHLRVFKGKKSTSMKWWYKRNYQSVRHEHLIGEYPQVSLAEAYKIATAFNVKVLENDASIHPTGLKAKHKSSVPSPIQTKTFADLCEGYADHLRLTNRVSWNNVRASLVKYGTQHKKVWNKKANQVTTDDVALIVNDKELQLKPQMRNRVLQAISTAFNTAMKMKYGQSPSDLIKGFEITSNPALIIPKSDVKLEKYEDYYFNFEQFKTFAKHLEELPEKWRTIGKLLILLGGQRPTQLMRVMKKDIDISKGEACITMFDDKGNAKANLRPHYVPLTKKAVELVKALMPFETGYLFEMNARYREKGKAERFELTNIKETKYFNRKIFSPIAQKMIEEGSWDKKPFTINILRKTGETFLSSAKCKIAPEIRNQFYSHDVTGLVGKHYNRNDYWEEKLECMKCFEEILP
jgi:integrase